jgi:hypothetical protein
MFELKTTRLRVYREAYEAYEAALILRGSGLELVVGRFSLPRYQP